MIRNIVVILVLVASTAGCASPTRVIKDAEANYNFVFPQMPGPKPEIMNSRVERVGRAFIGFIPMGSANGKWEFELIADSEWVSVLRKDFEPIRWDQISQHRDIPEWFDPSPERFTVWRLHPTSYAVAHLFIERTPKDKSKVHIFIRRH